MIRRSQGRCGAENSELALRWRASSHSSYDWTMTSTSAPEGPLQQQQQQQLVGSVAAPPRASNSRIPLDEISKLYHLPIAEAASILGVCTSVLKRICREHGVVRWPYRKYIAGKNADDIRKDSGGEGTNGLVDSSNMAKQKIDGSKMLLPTSVSSSLTFGSQVPNKTAGLTQDPSKLQRGIPMVGSTAQPHVARFSQDGWANTFQSSTRHIPTYMDEFKFGFPVHGLSSVTVKWWGSGNKESSEKSSKGEPMGENEEKHEACDTSNETSSLAKIDDKEDNNVECAEIKTEPKPSALLCSTRKNAVEYGRKTLKLGISKGYEMYKLSKKQKSVLLLVFKTSLPDQWKESFS
ncbi:putative transcription factor Nin-like family [Dioscorea sansibarensis]